MTSDIPFRVTGVQSDTIKTERAQAEKLREYSIAQESSEEEFTEWTEQAAFNPLAMSRRFQTLEKRVGKKEAESSKAEKKEKSVAEIKKIEDTAEYYQRRNPELKKSSLLLLRSRLGKNDSSQDVLRKVSEFYPDPSLADEAIDFLLETAGEEFETAVHQAKEELNKYYAREIISGKNIAAEARAFSQEGLGSPTALRDLYRSITGNPREPFVLFQELTTLFQFDKMKQVIEFILHSLGADLKAKGPSISRAELHRLLTEGKTLQAILVVFHFFRSRMKLILETLARKGDSLPAHINFELLAKMFMKYLQERYPSAEKVLSLARELHIINDLPLQVLLFTQMRDGTRNVPPKLFQSEKHRQDVLTSMMNAISELDKK